MADLIVQPRYEGVSGQALLEAVPVIGSAADAIEEFSKGNAMGLVDQAFAALDAVSMVVDPIATLGSSCAAFLLDYLSPLHEDLEHLTGSPEKVKALAATWDNLAKELDGTADDHARAAGQVLSSWRGPAADAYREAAEGLVQMLREDARACTSAADGLRVAAVIVQVVYEVVKGIISDLVGQLISLVVEELCSLGLGTPVVISQACTKIAAKAPQVVRWVEKIEEVMEEFHTKISRFTELTREVEVKVTRVKETFLHVETATMTIDYHEIEMIVASARKDVGIEFPEMLKGIKEGIEKGQEGAGERS